MPSTPDRPDDSDDPFAVAEAALRETAPAERSEHVDRPTEAIVEERPTVLVDDKALGARETVKIPGQRRPRARMRRAPLPVAAGFAMLWAAVLSYLPVAAVVGLARTFEAQGGLAGAARGGLAGWMLGHGVPIGTSIGPLGLAPLLLTLLVVWRLDRAGLHVTRAIGVRRSGKIGDALLVAFAIGLGYSLLGSVAALAVDGRGTEVTPARAAINFFVLGTLAAFSGALRGTDAVATIAGWLPGPLRHGVRTGLMASFFILAAGAAITGLSVAVGGGQAADMISAYRTGVAGQAGITLVSLAYGVNAVIWAAAYLLGPGFALGTGSAVRLTEVTVGPLPTVPLLAGLPNGPMGAAGTLLLAMPVVAGLAAGWLLTLRLRRPGDADADDGLARDTAAARRAGDTAIARRAGGTAAARRAGETAADTLPRWSHVLGGGLLAGPAAGIVLGVLGRLSGGPLGDGRLAMIGPDPWQVGLIATLVVGVSAALGAAAARTFGPAPK
ncbi:hypothetical protein HH310_38255 [Actinoplanes sp. TBRC 11911]|uniref:cell division protein PerM n=1 Tax=Actinoplanes sp. TBRC 11911 TaxID=2729386 RepID=UPI00145E54E3|nr:DUF6350 family protein [Actinoplanes sp. TBRC 11911]NMO57007.1 hypothetical protein [Actinoplanes sp. TBRC 11911]